MPLSPAQCRAARGLLRWSQAELEARSKVAKTTIANFELEGRQPYERTLDAMQAAFEKGGVEFIQEDGGGAGVRLRKPSASSRGAGGSRPKRGKLPAIGKSSRAEAALGEIGLSA